MLYRQYIELHLKYVLALVRDLNVIPVTRSEMKGHDLKELWKRARKGIVTKWPESDNHRKLERAQSIVLEFHRIDESGQEKRYTTLWNGEISLRNLPSELNLDGTRITAIGPQPYFRLDQIDS
jgi:hypothetical protein